MKLTEEEAKFLLDVLDSTNLSGRPQVLQKALETLASIRNKVVADMGPQPDQPAEIIVPAELARRKRQKG